MDKNQLQVGVNLGGWISQYSEYDHAHFNTFIKAEDIRRIADWGMDHVRLPVDYPVLEDDEHPGEYKASGFEYIERCLDWCKANNLKVILDLHKAPGYVFDSLDRISLFNDASQQERLANLWRELARHYGEQNDLVAFELLNEIVLPDSTPWNALYKQLVAMLRKIIPNSLIVLGGNRYNAASELQNMTLLDDNNILYTFHYYLPMVVTHFKAHWATWVYAYDRYVEYPGLPPVPGDDFTSRYSLKDYPELTVDRPFDIDYLARELQPAIDFAHKTGQSIYCGEFGVIDQAPLSNRINWTRDFVSLLRENGIGRAIWSYKAMDFGLVDTDGKIISDELIRIASMK